MRIAKRWSAGAASIARVLGDRHSSSCSRHSRMTLALD